MRIVSLLASGSEIVCALGAGEMLVGRSHECDNPAWVKRLPVCTTPAFDINVSSGAIDAEVKRRLRAGEPLYYVDTELIDSLKPDLLITQAHCEVCAVTPTDVKRAGCVVAGQVLALQAGSLAGIFDGTRDIGRAIDRENAAADLIAAMQRQMNDVAKSAAIRPAPTAVILEWTDPIFALGNWGPELVELANGRLLIGQKGEHSMPIPWQQVRDADPEFLVIAPCGFDLQRTIAEIPLLENLPGWFQLRAVRNAKVVLADGNKYFNRSGTTVVQTVEILAEIMHGRAAGHRGVAWKNYHELRGKTVIDHIHTEACARGSTTYIDPVTGYDVFTAEMMRQRGYCCENGCRHCPYKSEPQPANATP